MGLAGMIGEMMMRCDVDLSPQAPTSLAAIRGAERGGAARARPADHRARERRGGAGAARRAARRGARRRRRRSIGITGTGGAGKSSLTDELIRRLRLDQGDRAADRRDLDRPVAPEERRRAARRPHPHERDRPVARRPARLHALARDARLRQRDQRRAARRARRGARSPASTSSIVETSGIGQGDAAIVPLVDVPVYVMTPEFGAASQLEKIDMLDFAEFVAINKFDRKGAADALRDVAKQVQRNREAFGKRARRDAGVRHDGEPLQRRRRHRALPGDACRACAALGLQARRRRAAARSRRGTARTRCRSCRRRASRYLADIADAVRGYKRGALRAGAPGARGPAAARERAHAGRGQSRQDATPSAPSSASPTSARRGSTRVARRLLADWPEMQRAYAGDEYVVKIRDKRDPHLARPHDAVRQQDPEGRAAGVRGPRRDPQVAAARQRAGLVPVHRRHVRVQARERGPDADVRRRGRRLQDQHAASSCSRPACRPSACRPRSTRSRSTATTRRSGPTSTARSATRASRSPRSTT